MIEATVKTKKSPIEYLPTLQDTIQKFENEEEKMLMVLTYDFESSLPRHAPYLANTTLKNLDEFNKADDFDTFIRRHFRSSNAQKTKKTAQSAESLQPVRSAESPRDEAKEEDDQKASAAATTTEVAVDVDADGVAVAAVPMEPIQRADTLGDDDVINEEEQVRPGSFGGSVFVFGL